MSTSEIVTIIIISLVSGGIAGYIGGKITEYYLKRQKRKKKIE
jgi:hypothetical protein